jgi:hypothetical protein
VTFSPLDRRTLLRGGATAACFSLTGLGTLAADASPDTFPSPLTQPLAGWLVVAPAGGGHFTLTELDAQSGPARVLAVQTIPAQTSVAATARQASAAIVKIVAESWQVSAADCTCGQRRIEHRPSGRSVPFAMWTDFS